jgi:AcrR family transcriptional regulator
MKTTKKKTSSRATPAHLAAPPKRGRANAPAHGKVDPAAASRGTRRKGETRTRLIEAAYRLIAERGIDAVAINDITDAADVGFGSFYNHFVSKDAIHAAVVETLFDDFADALDHLAKDLEDPAEVIAVSVRHTLLRARRDPTWGRFLIREGQSERALSRGLGQRLLRDVYAGISGGRFDVPDPAMSVIAVGGGVLGAVVAQLQPSSQQQAALEEMGFTLADLPERAAAVLLHALGLSFAEAQAVARRPLPTATSAPR